MRRLHEHSWARWVVAGVFLSACGDKDDTGQMETTASTSGDSGDETLGKVTMSETSDGMDTGGSETGGADTSGTTTVTFIENPDGGGPANECDIWAQDCPMGEKCMPWDNTGGDSWNATKCSPIDPNPGQPGDSCTVEGSGVSGVDDCEIAAMCWDVDPETNMGTCVAFCEGSEANPLCDDPQSGCSISNEGVLILCLPYCDPLIQDCPEGNACYPESNGFFCSPDASGPDAGTYGDPCEYLNVCDPGLFCAVPEAVPGCAGAAGCCSEFCDLTEPTATCMGAGQECTPYYNEGEAPPGNEDIGVCLIPA